MKILPNTLPTDVTQLQAMDAKLQQALDAQDAKYQHLLEQFRLAQHQRFGAHGEAHPGQGELFNEAEDIIAADDAVTDGTCTTISYERKQSKRMPLPADLHLERVLHDITAQDKVCGTCETALHQIGEDVSEKLEFIPAQVKVIGGYMLRHKVKPGITGWAQINGWRGETDTLEKMKKRIEFDLKYINNWSLIWDLKIIFLTIFKGFINKNAY